MINRWDLDYYHQKRSMLEGGEYIKEFFEVDNSTLEILNIYGDILGLKFEEVQGDPSIWAEEGGYSKSWTRKKITFWDIFTWTCLHGMGKRRQ